jgi:hypothetical protein
MLKLLYYGTDPFARFTPPRPPIHFLWIFVFFVARLLWMVIAWQVQTGTMMATKNTKRHKNEVRGVRWSLLEVAFSALNS